MTRTLVSDRVGRCAARPREQMAAPRRPSCTWSCTPATSRAPGFSRARVTAPRADRLPGGSTWPSSSAGHAAGSWSAPRRRCGCRRRGRRRQRRDGSRTRAWADSHARAGARARPAGAAWSPRGPRASSRLAAEGPLPLGPWVAFARACATQAQARAQRRKLRRPAPFRLDEVYSRESFAMSRKPVPVFAFAPRACPSGHGSGSRPESAWPRVFDHRRRPSRPPCRRRPCSAGRPGRAVEARRSSRRAPAHRHRLLHARS